MADLPEGIRIRSADLDAAEIAWFSALCNEDCRHLGVLDEDLRSSWEHCSDIVKTADRCGYQNILLPSGYVVGQEPLEFASAVAPQLEQLQLLVAVRMGEIHPPMLGRAIATLDHIMKGRLTINIISSDLPGTKMESQARYDRSREVIQILKDGWTKDKIDFHGDYYDIELGTDPLKPYQQNGGPLLYFGGISPAAQELCAEHCDVFLMWPETEDRLVDTMRNMTALAEKHGRVIDYGLRIHMIVRETEEEAREAARELASKLDAGRGEELKHRSQDSESAGVKRQDELREQAADEDDYIEPNIWSGIGRARSGCGSAIVGDPDQVYEKLQRYMSLGFRAFIFSGYPHKEECELFAKHVLPRLKTCKLPEVYGRVPEGDPVTPLTTAPRK